MFVELRVSSLVKRVPSLVVPVSVSLSCAVMFRNDARLYRGRRRAVH
jgi:hypothetical protein